MTDSDKDLSSRRKVRKKQKVRQEQVDGISSNAENKRRRKIQKAVEASRERFSVEINELEGENQNGIQKRKKRMRQTDEDRDNEETVTRKSPSTVATHRSLNKEMSDKEEGDIKQKRPKVQKRRMLDENTSSLENLKSKKTSFKDIRQRKTTRDRIKTLDVEDTCEEVSAMFRVDKDDLLPSEEVSQTSTSTPHLYQTSGNFTAHPALSSQANDVLYIEKKDGQGFAREHKSRVNLENGNTNYPIQLIEEDQGVDTALDFMLGVHMTFRNLAMIGHGLLAGMGISQCIFVYILSETNNSTFLEYYFKLALPFQAVFYFLLSVSTVSILDRFVSISSGWKDLIMGLLTRPFRVLAILAYILALLFTISISQLDEKISLYKDLPGLWNDTDNLNTWRVMNLLRVVCSVIGWVLVAVSPVDDQTAKAIQAGIDHENTGGSTATVHIELNSIG